ncbi:MAG: FtsX-like permease family protein [Acidobacteria bacterium]|nr:FtsX-like permease family protein [Acidobacteriota bacterium]
MRAAAASLRALTRAFPGDFRARHAGPLLQNATDLLISEHARAGLPALAVIWLRLTRDFIASGIAERSTRRRANRLSLPTTRDRISMLDTLLLDLRFAARSLMQRPQLTGLAIVTLALGIGSSAAMFSVVDGILLRPLPYPDADRLMSVYVTIPEWEEHESFGRMAREARWSYEDFVDWYDRQESFELAALTGAATANLSGLGDAERVTIGLAGLDLFRMLGANPVAGRFFATDDEASDGRVAVVSWQFWQERLGGTSTALGSSFQLGGDPYEVVGVLPEGFAVSSSNALPIWIPIFDNRPGGYFPGNTGDMNHVFGVTALIKDGVDPVAAAAEGGRLLPAIGGPDHFAQHGANVISRLEILTRNIRAPLMILMAAVLVVLLVACANVATFLLGQAVDRQQEMAVRGALGAGKLRIARQLLTESLVLGAISGVFGIGLAYYGMRALVALAPAALPRVAEVSLDYRALGFALAISVLSGLLFGLAPALTLARTDLSGAMRAERVGGVGRSRLQGLLVVAEVALATVLLVGAGLLTRSFMSANSVDPGFRPDGVLTLMATPENAQFMDAEGEFDDGAMRTFYDVLQDRLRALPGVEGVALTQSLPFSGSRANNNISPEGYVPDETEMLIAERRFVSSNYLELMGTRLVEGRHLQPTDDVAEAAAVVVITENMAQRFWPGQTAVGRILGWWGGESEIVGVVADIHDRYLTLDLEMQFYTPAAPHSQAGGSLVIRTQGDPSSLIASVRAAVRDHDPEMPIRALLPMSDRIYDSLAAERYRTQLIVVFAITAAILAVLGLYGVTARAVAGRTRELGIRLALGAVGRNVVQLVLNDGVRLAAFGTVAGLLTSLAGTRLLEGMLFRVEPNDPTTLVAIAVVVGSLAVLASLVPAIRASRLDPVRALKGD